jgi:hypothetical protein
VASAVAARGPGPDPGRHVAHWSVPPAHDDARTLWTKRIVVSGSACRAQGRYRGRSSDLPEEQVTASSEIPATPSRRCCQRGSAPRAAEDSVSAGSDAGDDNGRRARAAVMRYGCRRVECFEGYEPRCGERRQVARPLGAWLSGHEASERGRASGNATNPVRIGLQHCPSPRAEKAVEVVGIHEDGTRCAAGGAGTPKAGGNVDRE